jgi:hypothetical protein
MGVSPRPWLEANKKPAPKKEPVFLLCLERETRVELATSTLARLHSTTELLPRNGKEILQYGAIMSRVS